jgi:hypothetical protein
MLGTWRSSTAARRVRAGAFVVSPPLTELANLQSEDARAVAGNWLILRTSAEQKVPVPLSAG